MQNVFGGLNATFFQANPLIGMVHLRALPGSPGWDNAPIETIISHAVADAHALEAGGADAIMVENFFDVPFAKDAVPPHTIAAMTLAVQAVRRAVSLPIGVNVLRNDARAALAIAHLCGAQFVRVNVYVGAAVTDQGIIEGAARSAVLYLREIAADVAIWADVCVKHAVQLGTVSLEEAARDAVHRGRADAIIVSGTATGYATDIEEVRHVKSVVPDTPVLIGSGFNAMSAAPLLLYADGAIVGTSLKTGGNVTAPIERDLVRALRSAMGQGKNSPIRL